MRFRDDIQVLGRYVQLTGIPVHITETPIIQTIRILKILWLQPKSVRLHCARLFFDFRFFVKKYQAVNVNALENILIFRPYEMD